MLAALGATLYGKHCASCHGRNLEGGSRTGGGAGSTTPFRPRPTTGVALSGALTALWFYRDMSPTASHAASSQPWNTAASPTCRTDGVRRRRPSSAR